MSGKSQPIDNEAEYNNRAAVPDHPVVMARWKADADAARDTYPPVVLPYGASERETINLFDAGPDAPVVMFIHGGYWQALDPSWFSWVAPPLLANGISVAIPSYDLCPTVRLAVIVDQMRSAARLLSERTGRLPLATGHSAGGHLSACLLSDGLASAAVAISGVFDLEPLMPTSLNVALKLDPAEAEALSPIRWPVPNGAMLDCVVGGSETLEFGRQSRDMAEIWAAKGAVTRFEALPGLNHFTVLDALADPDGALVQRIAALAHHTGMSLSASPPR
ncbi:alpha/beta hydrolase [soil metagenome]